MTKKSVDILGLPVISITEGCELGVSKTLIVDAKAGAVAAITIEDEDWYRGVKLLPYSSVIAIGRDAVTVTSSSNILTLDEASDFEAMLDANIRVIGTKAITKTGTINGKVSEIFIAEDGMVEKVEIVDPHGGVSEIPADEISIFGKQVTVIGDPGDGAHRTPPVFSMPEPTAEVAPEPEPMPKPAIESSPEPMPELTPEPPVPEPVLEPMQEPTPEPEPVPAPAVEVAPEPMHEPTLEPSVPEPILEPIQELTLEPETVPEPAVELSPEPISEPPAPEPVPEPEPEPISDALPEPPTIEAEPTAAPEPAPVPEPEAEEKPAPKQTKKTAKKASSASKPEPAPVSEPEAEEEPPAPKPAKKASAKPKKTAAPRVKKATASTQEKKETSDKAVMERHRRFLIGKKASRTIAAGSGAIIVKAGEELTDEVLQKAQLAGKLIELSMNAQ